MLTIIPIEVILKIPRIQEFLHSQTFFQGGGKASTSDSSGQKQGGGSSDWETDSTWFSYAKKPTSQREEAIK